MSLELPPVLKRFGERAPIPVMARARGAGGGRASASVAGVLCTLTLRAMTAWLRETAAGVNLARYRRAPRVNDPRTP